MAQVLDELLETRLLSASSPYQTDSLSKKKREGKLKL